MDARGGCLVCLVLISCSTVGADDAPKLVSSLDGVALEMVTKTKVSELSSVFLWLSDAKNVRTAGLTERQISLIRRFESVVEDIVRSWLVSYLEAGPSASGAAAAERLSEGKNLMRARVMPHAEQILLQAVLTDAQSDRVFRETGRKAGPLLTGHYGAMPVVEDAHTWPVSALRESLIAHSNRIEHSGDIFYFLLGAPGILQQLPNGVGHIKDPATRKSAISRMPKVSISRPRRDLVERLDVIMLEVLREWRLRDFDSVPPPSQAVLADRVFWHQRLDDNLAVHSEAIIAGGILTPSELDQCLAVLWRLMNFRALGDPALVRRLGLKRSQLEAIRDVLESMRRDEEERQQNLVLLSPVQQPEQREQNERYYLSVQMTNERAEAAILDILSPGQARALQRILAGSPSSPKRGQVKRANPVAVK